MALIFNYKNTAVHMMILALMVVVFTVLCANISNIVTFIIGYVIMGLVVLLLTVELIYITIALFTHEKHSLYYVLRNPHSRELFFAPIETLLSIYFAMAHFIVFHITGLWYFCILNVIYLIGLSIKSYQIHIEESLFVRKQTGLILSNIFMAVLSSAFFATVFFTNYFAHELHEPSFLFILDIVFFFLKLVFAVMGLVSALKHNSEIMISYSFAALILTFFTFYSVVITLLHENHALVTLNIFVVGFILSITSIVISIVVLIVNSIKRKK